MAIDAIVKSQRQIGTGSEREHYDKLIRDYDLLPDNIKESVKDIIEERERQNYVPHRLLQTSYTLFWELRQTKSFDFPITHLDIQALTQLYDIRLDAWEVKCILTFDAEFYKASNKYKD